jgi:hypothetical protein
VDAVLSVLAFALGPLGEADLLQLMRHIHDLKGVTAIDRLLDPLRRWVFGNGKGAAGYVLSHPKVGEYLQRSRFAAVAPQLRQGFAAWGKSHCVALNESLLTSQQASPYCLQFLPEHLKQVKAFPSDFMITVQDGWRLAWEHLEGGQRGFAKAVQTAYMAQKGDDANLRLGSRWRCALTLSSIKSLGKNIPVKLLLAAVDAGVLAIRQAAHFADLKGPSEESVKLLAGLVLSSREDVALQSELLFAAHSAAKAIGHDHFRAEALPVLAALAPHLAPEQRDEVLREALAAAEAIVDVHYRAPALAALAPHLTPEKRDEVLREALAAAKAIGIDCSRADTLAASSNDRICAETLAALAPHLSLEQVREALTAARAIGDDNSRTEALASLSPHLAQEERDEVLHGALAAAKARGDDYSRARALAALVPHLAPQRRDEVLREALAAATATGDDRARAEGLAILAPHLSLNQVSEALATAKAIGNKYSRPRALAFLVPHLTPEQRDGVLSEALTDRQ